MGEPRDIRMMAPFDRKRLRERNALDEADERERVGDLTPAECLGEALALSDLVRRLQVANGTLTPSSLPEKARLWVLPLRSFGADE